jgi:hypothetical protein
MHKNRQMSSHQPDQERAGQERAELRIRRIIDANSDHRLTTQQVCLAFEHEALRVECNLVRSAATDQEGLALRIAPADATQYLAVVIPVLEDGRLVLLGRYRYAAGRWSVELPRSSCHTSDAGWKQIAEEHLLNDTGLRAESMRLLGAIQVDPALIVVSTLVILATGCVGPEDRPADPVEGIAGSLAVTLDEFHRLARQGEIVCGTTLAALSLYQAWRP